jgi:hypothetical protein
VAEHPKRENSIAHTYTTDDLPDLIERLKSQYIEEFNRLLKALSLELSREELMFKGEELDVNKPTKTTRCVV